MSETIARESPLVGHHTDRRPAAASNEPIALSERPFLTHINLRGDPGDAGFLAAVESVLGAGLPLQANTFCQAGERRLYWLGPDEWLMVAPSADEEALAGRLRAALSGRHFAVTEIGHGQTIVVMDGPGARRVLAQGCPLDLHPRSFGPGRCAQSHLVKAGILIAQVGAERFELVVRRSFADYLWRWLIDTCGDRLSPITARAAGRPGEPPRASQSRLPADRQGTAREHAASL